MIAPTIFFFAITLFKETVSSEKNYLWSLLVCIIFFIYFLFNPKRKPHSNNSGRKEGGTGGRTEAGTEGGREGEKEKKKSRSRPSYNNHTTKNQTLSPDVNRYEIKTISATLPRSRLKSKIAPFISVSNPWQHLNHLPQGNNAVSTATSISQRTWLHFNILAKQKKKKKKKPKKIFNQSKVKNIFKITVYYKASSNCVGIWGLLASVNTVEFVNIGFSSLVCEDKISCCRLRADLKMKKQRDKLTDEIWQSLVCWKKCGLSLWVYRSFYFSLLKYLPLAVWPEDVTLEHIKYWSLWESVEKHNGTNSEKKIFFK